MLTEFFHLIGDSSDEVRAGWALVRSAAIRIISFGDDDLPALESLMARYHDRPNGLCGCHVSACRRAARAFGNLPSTITISKHTESDHASVSQSCPPGITFLNPLDIIACVRVTLFGFLELAKERSHLSAMTPVSWLPISSRRADGDNNILFDGKV